MSLFYPMIAVWILGIAIGLLVAKTASREERGE